MKNTSYKPIYIVISQTGTILSRILKIITHKEYNHSSISLSDNLDIMYSFGRKNPYNPFWGGFVAESQNFGTFKRFPNARVIVLKVLLNEDEYFKLQAQIYAMDENSEYYGYNYLGLCMAAFRLNIKRTKKYYCSEFVKDMLVLHNVTGANELDKIAHPMSFLKLPDTELVYKGKLVDYGLHNLENTVNWNIN